MEESLGGLYGREPGRRKQRLLGRPLPLSRPRASPPPVRVHLACVYARGLPWPWVTTPQNGQ